MLKQIKSGVERELLHYATSFLKPPLSAIPRPFAEAISQYVQREGKRLRAVLFVVAYRGYATRTARNLYRSAAALELLHDFILIHDDLIDHAALRRGGASMHAGLDALLNGQRGMRFRGQDLALIVGDMMYAMAIQGFLAVHVRPERKQRALELLTRTALYTGCGELDELLHTLQPLSAVGPDVIYRIYDWKTGHYTFASPLAMGATLAGAGKAEVQTLMDIGIALGRAFQIRDDLLDLCGAGSRFGKPGLIDLREGKKTLPVWYAYQKSNRTTRALMEKVLEAPGASAADIQRVADVIDQSGAIEYATGEMARLLKQSIAKIRRTRLALPQRDFLITYASQLLQPPEPATATARG